MADILNIILEPEQKELLSKLVEAQRKVPRESRHIFITAGPTMGDSRTQIMHDGFEGNLYVYGGDLEVLADQGILRREIQSSGSNYNYDVTPLGYKYYDEIIKS